MLWEILLVLVLTPVLAYSVLWVRASIHLAQNPLEFLEIPRALIDRRLKLLKEDSTASTKAPKSYLVIGGSGQAGKWVVAHLLKTTTQPITVFDRINAWKDEPRVQFIEGDVRDADHLVKVCAGKTHVVHLASVIALGNFSHKILKEVNINGTVNVVEACLKSSTVRALVYTSSNSSCVGYNRINGMDPDLPLTEVKTFFPYGQSKSILDKYVRECNSPAMRTAVVRPSAINSADDVFTVQAIYRKPDQPSAFEGQIQDVVYAPDLGRAHAMLVEALGNEDPKVWEKCAGQFYYCARFADTPLEGCRYDKYIDLLHKTFHPEKPPKTRMTPAIAFIARTIADTINLVTLSTFVHELSLFTTGIYNFQQGKMSFPDGKDGLKAYRDFGYKPEWTAKATAEDMKKGLDVMFGKPASGAAAKKEE